VNSFARSILNCWSRYARQTEGLNKINPILLYSKNKQRIWIKLPNRYLAHLCRNFFSDKPNCASYEIELYDKSRRILQIGANVLCRSITCQTFCNLSHCCSCPWESMSFNLVIESIFYLCRIAKLSNSKYGRSILQLLQVKDWTLNCKLSEATLVVLWHGYAKVVCSD